jgi:hypothetical protein
MLMTLRFGSMALLLAVLSPASAEELGTASLDLDFQRGLEVVEDSNGRQTAELLLDGRPVRLAVPARAAGGPAFNTPVLQFEGGDPGQRRAAIVEDPVRPGNRVLEFSVTEPNVTSPDGTRRKSRVQMNVYGNTSLREVYQTVRVRLGAGLGLLKEFPDPVRWFTLSEWWNNAGWTGDVHPFRITVDLVSAGPGKGLHLSARATVKPQHDDVWSRLVWHQTDSRVEVPIEQWMRIEYYFREGDAQTGRFMVRLTVDGAAPVTVIDVNNFTHHPDDDKANGLGHFNPAKLYTSRALTDHVRQRGGSLMVMWDDLSLLGCAAQAKGTRTACSERMGLN